MDIKETALSIAQKEYGEVYLMDSWVENEWHIMKLPEVWQANVICSPTGWYIEIPELEGDVVIGSFMREVK